MYLLAVHFEWQILHPVKFHDTFLAVTHKIWHVVKCMQELLVSSSLWSPLTAWIFCSIETITYGTWQWKHTFKQMPFLISVLACSYSTDTDKLKVNWPIILHECSEVWVAPHHKLENINKQKKEWWNFWQCYVSGINSQPQIWNKKIIFVCTK